MVLDFWRSYHQLYVTHNVIALGQLNDCWRKRRVFLFNSKGNESPLYIEFPYSFQLEFAAKEEFSNGSSLKNSEARLLLF